MDIAEQYDELLKVDPGSEAFASWAEQLCDQGLWAEAVRVCREGLTFYPRDLRGRVLLGWALKELAEYGEAEKILMEAAGEIQKNALAFGLLSEFAERAGKVDQAKTFRDVCQDLQSLEIEQPPPSETMTRTEPAGEDKRPGTATLLTSLLERFEAKPAGAAMTPRIFSAEDRQTLAHILEGGRK